MTISRDLFLSILSMDSYNRGYDAGIEGLGGAGSSIGTATVRNEQIPQGSETFGFAATAYSTAYGTVISYRGTDNPDPIGILDGASDMWNGWIFGAGVPAGTLALARAFYQSVTGTSAFSDTGNAILTGHSLGGGLAAHVAGRRGQHKRPARHSRPASHAPLRRQIRSLPSNVAQQ
jgi:hypothetical protein